MTTTYESHSPEATRAWAQALAATLRPGDCLGLIGDLGAGKTLMAAAIKEALGAQGLVQSPTFTLLRTYPQGIGRAAVHHFDAYRLTDEASWYELGFDEVVADDSAVSVIEWADRVRGALPAHTLWLAITVQGDTARSIQLTYPEGDSRAHTRF